MQASSKHTVKNRYSAAAAANSSVPALRMEWRQALHWNPMVYPLALCCGYAAVCFLMGRTRQAASIRFWGIVGVLLLAVWLLRLPSIISGDSLLFIRPGSLGDFLVSRFLC